MLKVTVMDTVQSVALKTEITVALLLFRQTIILPFVAVAIQSHLMLTSNLVEAN